MNCGIENQPQNERKFSYSLLFCFSLYVVGCIFVELQCGKSGKHPFFGQRKRQFEVLSVSQGTSPFARPSRSTTPHK